MIRPPDDASLADLFKRLGVPHEWLSGFFAALTMGPDSVANQAWMDPLLEPGELDKDELPGVVALLLAMHDAIGGAVREAPSRVVPEPGDLEGVTAFCEGFINGARLHPSWSKDDVGARRLFPFGLLAGAFADDDITNYEGEEVVDKAAFRDRHRADLEKHVIALRDHWQQRKVAGRTGRNAPCPCGSGKKFKKCCAA